jgi:hypothetical protein
MIVIHFHYCGDISLIETSFVRVEDLGARQTSINFGFHTTCFHTFLQSFHTMYFHIFLESFHGNRARDS